MKELTHITINSVIYISISIFFLSKIGFGFSYFVLLIVIVYSVLPDIDTRFGRVKEKLKISHFFIKKRRIHNIWYGILASFPLLFFGYFYCLIAFISYSLHLLEDKISGK